MKDIPVFTGAHGVATLVLRQIPWSGCAYVLVRSVWTDAAAFLQECLGFCRACGAKQVFASWELEELPAEHAYDMLQMQMEKADLPQAEPVAVQSVTKENAPAFLELFNRLFCPIPNAAAYTGQDLSRLTAEQTGFLVYRAGHPAALAEISKQGLEAIAVVPQAKGLGYPLAATVLQMVPSKTITLKVASTNEPALRLYARLGMEQTAVLSRWWKLW